MLPKPASRCSPRTCSETTLIAAHMNHPTIGITSGEPAGIGPELCAMLAARHVEHPYAARLVLLGDRTLLESRARRIGIDVTYVDYDGAAIAPPHATLELVHQPLAAPVVPGHPDPTNAHSVLA